MSRIPIPSFQDTEAKDLLEEPQSRQALAWIQFFLDSKKGREAKKENSIENAGVSNTTEKNRRALSSLP